jgi:hypothetical protein
MRPLLLLLLLAPKDKLEDAFWGFELALPGLKKVLALGDPALAYRGKSGPLLVSIRVHESEKARAVAQWLEDSRKSERPRARDLVTGANWLVYKQKTLAGFDEHHGHAFFVRGAQCFELHVMAELEDATGAIRGAFRAFTLRAQAPGTLLGYRIARELGRPLDDPEVLLRAGVEYVTGRSYGARNLSLAAKVLAQARAALKPGVYKPQQRWMLFEHGGLALRDKPAEAAEWHALAETAATDDAPRRQSAYNLACASSRAGKLDQAFAALHRAYSGDAKPVTDEHVSRDKDLENCRRDERWHEFWREKVKG